LRLRTERNYTAKRREGADQMSVTHIEKPPVLRGRPRERIGAQCPP
jgi:hypothetical protein